MNLPQCSSFHECQGIQHQNQCVFIYLPTFGVFHFTDFTLKAKKMLVSGYLDISLDIVISHRLIYNTLAWV